MSITITCEFSDPQRARQAADHLRRRGYTVSGGGSQSGRGSLLVAHPFGAMGRNTFGNRLMGAMPPMAENAVTAQRGAVVSVLTDDTQTADCRRLMESLGGSILS